MTSPADIHAIAFDAKRAVSNNTGLGNYSRLVIDTLAQALPNTRMMLYAPRAAQNPRLKGVLAHDNVEMRTPEAPLWRRASSLWRVWRGLSNELRSSGATLYHGLSNELPLDINRAGIPSVVTIHDLIYLHHPQGYKAIDRAIYDYKYGTSARNATRIIAISETTKKDIVNLYGISPAKIDVVYQGCDPLFAQPVQKSMREEVRARYSLPQRYIISVGTIEPRKNQMLAVEALRLLPSDVKLVIVGRARADYGRIIDDAVRRYGLTDRVIRLEGVPFQHLPALYAMACASSYTSRAEGFGLPVIESINAGTPVVATTGTCLEEAGGPGAVYVDPDDVDAAAQALAQFVDDTTFRTATVEAGRAHTARFCPENFVAGLLETYTRAIRDFNS